MGAVRKSFEKPDETREIPDGVIVGVELGGGQGGEAHVPAGVAVVREAKTDRGRRRLPGRRPPETTFFALDGLIWGCVLDWQPV